MMSGDPHDQPVTGNRAPPETVDVSGSPSWLREPAPLGERGRHLACAKWGSRGALLLRDACLSPMCTGLGTESSGAAYPDDGMPLNSTADDIPARCIQKWPGASRGSTDRSRNWVSVPKTVCPAGRSTGRSDPIANRMNRRTGLTITTIQMRSVRQTEETRYTTQGVGGIEPHHQDSNAPSITSRTTRIPS